MRGKIREKLRKCDGNVVRINEEAGCDDQLVIMYTQQNSYTIRALVTGPFVLCSTYIGFSDSVTSTSG